MTVYEPMTLATDLALGGFTLVLAAKLRTHGQRSFLRAPGRWAAAFVCSALAAILGGVSHGFGPAMAASTRDALWTATILVGGGTAFFLVAAAAELLLNPTRRLLLAAAGLKLAVYLFWVGRHPEFRWLIYDYGSALLVVAALHLSRLLAPVPAGRDERAAGETGGSWWVLAGVAASVVAALMQQTGLSLHQHFNHNDLFHVLQMGATALLYRGARTHRSPSSDIPRRDRR